MKMEEDGDSAFPQNFGTRLPNCTLSRPIKPQTQNLNCGELVWYGEGEDKVEKARGRIRRRRRRRRKNEKRKRRKKKKKTKAF
jgi:hypothetical protein